MGTAPGLCALRRLGAWGLRRMDERVLRQAHPQCLAIALCTNTYTGGVLKCSRKRSQISALYTAWYSVGVTLPALIRTA